RGLLLAAGGQFATQQSALRQRGDADLGHRLMLGALAGHPTPETPRNLLGPGASMPELAAAGLNALLANDSTTRLAATDRLRHAPPPLDAYGAMLASCLDGRVALLRGDSAQARTLLHRAAEVRSFQDNAEL